MNQKLQNPLLDFELKCVQITDDYCRNAFEKEIRYLKSLNADKLLAGFRETRGLSPKAKKYDGWENTEIKGHTLGHYLMAMAQTYAATSDMAIRDTLDYMIGELEHCQFENGYLFASGEALFDQVENRKPAWVPWYTMHKILCGLVGVYKATVNPKAICILKKLADWVYNRCKGWSKETRRVVLAVEYGGMNDALYEVYKLTGDENHAFAAHQFDEIELFSHIHNGNDVLNGKHANTTIPKFLGALNRYLALGEGEEFYLEAAERFWDTVVSHHSYVTGGNSEWEHFGAPDILDAERTNCNCETCNTYNMLLLSRELFKLTGDVKYSNFYENAFINAILSSQNPETGMSMYFQPMATGYFKVYGTPFDKFWCCTGTGMENFTKLSDSIYFHSERTVYINQYLSSILTWEEMGIKLTQTADIPNKDSAHFAVELLHKKCVAVSLKFRVPDWIYGDIFASVDGVKTGEVSGGYLEITREWQGGEQIVIQLPTKITVHPLPDNPQTMAFKYGPVVLSAGLGTEDMVESRTGIMVSIATKNFEVKDFITVLGIRVQEWLQNIDQYLLKKEGRLEFVLKNAEESLVFTPHYRQHTERYGIYWTIVEPDSKELKAYLEKKRAAELLEQATIDCIPLANDQYELKHEIDGLNTRTGTWDGYPFRNADSGGWFGYTVKVDPNAENRLLLKYYTGDSGRTFDILVNDRLLASETILKSAKAEFYDKTYVIPQELIDNHTAVSLKFASTNGSIAGSVFGVLRILKG